MDVQTADALSYFEYTTLLAIVAFWGCEYVVLEAGLGGEFDATNVFDKVLSVFTPIDFDHSAFLGNAIESIAGTKLRSMQNTALLGIQQHADVKTIAQTIAQGCQLYAVQDLADARISAIGLHLSNNSL